MIDAASRAHEAHERGSVGIGVDSADCSTCKLQAAVCVLLTVGQQMMAEGRWPAFVVTVADVTSVVLTGDAQLIGPLVDDLMALQHKVVT